MKKINKKGFTIVELVIVIAVIGILAAVLIPTFANVIENANKNAAIQEVNNAYKDAYTQALADGKFDSGESKTSGDFTFTFDATGKCTGVAVKPESDFGYTVSVSDGKVTVE